MWQSPSQEVAVILILLLIFKNRWGKIACLFQLNVIYWYLRCRIQNLHIKIFMSVKKIWSVFSVNMESYTGPPYLSRMPTSVNSFLQDIISNAFVPQSGEFQLFSEEQYWWMTQIWHSVSFPQPFVSDFESHSLKICTLKYKMVKLHPWLSTKSCRYVGACRQVPHISTGYSCGWFP